ncbi:MAG: hypothetical protein EOP48_34390 [Sphingobacteriales bacterium]|nr:MAG: hypothetical protein EOP48_34390 [Sphingobacteriales bacterium]
MTDKITGLKTDVKILNLDTKTLNSVKMFLDLRNKSRFGAISMSLERIEFYSYKGVGGFTAGVEGSGEVFKTYSIDFSGVNGGEKEKSCKLLCYFKGSKKPDATIIVTPLITYK